MVVTTQQTNSIGTINMNDAKFDQTYLFGQSFSLPFTVSSPILSYFDQVSNRYFILSYIGQYAFPRNLSVGDYTRCSSNDLITFDIMSPEFTCNYFIYTSVSNLSSPFYVNGFGVAVISKFNSIGSSSWNNIMQDDPGVDPFLDPQYITINEFSVYNKLVY